jgi:hypothetical protein
LHQTCSSTGRKAFIGYSSRSNKLLANAQGLGGPRGHTSRNELETARKLDVKVKFFGDIKKRLKLSTVSDDPASTLSKIKHGGSQGRNLPAVSNKLFDGSSQKQRGVRLFQHNYVKVEDMSGKYRPFYREYDKHDTPIPKLSLKASGSACPFDFRAKSRGGHKSKVKEHSKPRYRKPSLKGYCECCDVKYEHGIERHRKSTNHVAFAKDGKNYKQIDAYIKDGLSHQSAFDASSSDGEGWSADEEASRELKFESPEPTQQTSEGMNRRRKRNHATHAPAAPTVTPPPTIHPTQAAEKRRAGKMEWKMSPLQMEKKAMLDESDCNTLSTPHKAKTKPAEKKSEKAEPKSKAQLTQSATVVQDCSEDELMASHQDSEVVPTPSKPSPLNGGVRHCEGGMCDLLDNDELNPTAKSEATNGDAAEKLVLEPVDLPQDIPIEQPTKLATRSSRHTAGAATDPEARGTHELKQRRSGRKQKTANASVASNPHHSVENVVPALVPDTHFPPLTLPPKKKQKLCEATIQEISSDKQHLTLEFLEGGTFESFPSRLVGPWGPFETGASVFAVYPERAEPPHKWPKSKFVYPAKVEKKSMYDGKEAYDILFDDGDVGNQLPEMFLVSADAILGAPVFDPNAVANSNSQPASSAQKKRQRPEVESTGENNMVNESSELETPKKVKRHKGRRQTLQNQTSLTHVLSSPVGQARGTPERTPADDWDADAVDDTPPQPKRVTMKRADAPRTLLSSGLTGSASTFRNHRIGGSSVPGFPGTGLPSFPSASGKNAAKVAKTYTPTGLKPITAPAAVEPTVPAAVKQKERSKQQTIPQKSAPPPQQTSAQPTNKDSTIISPSENKIRVKSEKLIGSKKVTQAPRSSDTKSIRKVCRAKAKSSINKSKKASIFDFDCDS